MTYMKRGLEDRKRTVPQSQPIPGQEARMAKNEAGGFTFKADSWQKYQRWLILGSESNLYYATAEKQTVQASDALRDCIRQNGVEAVNMAVDVSVAGRSIKPETSIVAVAYGLIYGDADTKKAAEQAVSKVCRTGTHILHLAQYINQIGAWSRLKRRAVANWYTSKTTDSLAFQVAKYQNRDGWTHKDVLRLTHAKPLPGAQTDIFHWIMNGADKDHNLPHILGAMEDAKKADKAGVIGLIKEYGLSREMLPTQFLSDPDVAVALMDKQPPHALIRNLANYTRYGVFQDRNVLRMVMDRLTDQEKLVKARVHPIDALKAMLTYGSGHGNLGNNSWVPVQALVDALDQAFYKTFKGLETIGGNILVAIDESGSMHSGEIGGVPGLHPALASAAYAMTVASTDPTTDFIAFTDTVNTIREVPIAARRRLDDVLKTFGGVGRGTDCAAPIEWAKRKGRSYDLFVIITDNQTWAGAHQVQQVADHYRQTINPKARFVTVAMAGYGGNILDTERPENFHVSGFDASAPELIRLFAQGEL